MSIGKAFVIRWHAVSNDGLLCAFTGRSEPVPNGVIAPWQHAAKPMATFKELVYGLYGNPERCNLELIVKEQSDALSQIFRQFLNEEFTMRTDISSRVRTSQRVFSEIRIAKPAQYGQYLIS